LPAGGIGQGHEDLVELIVGRGRLFLSHT